MENPTSNELAQLLKTELELKGRNRSDNSVT